MTVVSEMGEMAQKVMIGPVLLVLKDRGYFKVNIVYVFMYDRDNVR